MFSFYSVILDLIKARTHKYVRRIPVGATKTGATKYRYFYHGQEGHGKGLAHESELVVGASFVFNAEGENKYHAHIIKVDGDMITVKHDDGAKKGTEHVYTKEAFQKLVHFEHRNALEQARQKASKQLADFQQMKERGAKVKQGTLDKLQAQVDKLSTDSKNKTKQKQGIASNEIPLGAKQEEAPQETRGNEIPFPFNTSDKMNIDGVDWSDVFDIIKELEAKDAPRENEIVFNPTKQELGITREDKIDNIQDLLYDIYANPKADEPAWRSGLRRLMDTFLKEPESNEIAFNPNAGKKQEKPAPAKAPSSPTQSKEKKQDSITQEESQAIGDEIINYLGGSDKLDALGLRVHALKRDNGGLFIRVPYVYGKRVDHIFVKKNDLGTYDVFFHGKMVGTTPPKAHKIVRQVPGNFLVNVIEKNTHTKM